MFSARTFSGRHLSQNPDLCPQGLSETRGSGLGAWVAWVSGAPWVHRMAWVRGAPWVCGWLGFMGDLGSRGSLGLWGTWV